MSFSIPNTHEKKKDASQDSNGYLDEGDIDNHVETEKQGDHEGKLHDAVAEGDEGSGVRGFIPLAHRDCGNGSRGHNAR